MASRTRSLFFPVLRFWEGKMRPSHLAGHSRGHRPGGIHLGYIVTQLSGIAEERARRSSIPVATDSLGFRQSGNRSGTSTTPSPLQSPRVSLPLSRDSKPRNRIEWAMGLTHRGLHRDGIGPKRTDDTFGQACRIAFASLRQTDDFFSDRYRHGSPTVSDI
jgi:hypothetical protein